MKKLQRYDLSASLFLSENDNGDMVTYDDYQKLEFRHKKLLYGIYHVIENVEDSESERELRVLVKDESTRL